jgi:hypothetical protein
MGSCELYDFAFASFAYMLQYSALYPCFRHANDCVLYTGTIRVLILHDSVQLSVWSRAYIIIRFFYCGIHDYQLKMCCETQNHVP